LAKEIVGSLTLWFSPSLHYFYLGTNCSVKINCPITGLQRHNAVVLDIESTADNTVCIRIVAIPIYVSIHSRFEFYFVNQHVSISNHVPIFSIIRAVLLTVASKNKKRTCFTCNSYF
jgi:hypothetical protein